MSSILFVFTSANRTLRGLQTGWYLPEAAHPWYILSPHATIDFAAPAGPNPEVDEDSVQIFADDEEAQKFLKDPVVLDKLAKTKKLSEVNVADYDIIFYIGGHGPVIDLASDPLNAKIASQFFQAGKITAAVCHGTAALAGAVDADGKSIYAGRRVTGFSTAEEIVVGKVEDIPFLPEAKVVELGGKYEKAAELWAPYVVIDGNLYTGQNPASAAPLAKEILKALK